MAFVLYYIVVFPLSLLPLRIIYLVSDCFYLLLITVIPYRKKVIIGNLKRSFPSKNDQEIKRLSKKFYRHFCDILAEGIKNLSISEAELRKRIQLVNPEVLEEMYKKNKSILLVSGHFNNWEWLISAQNFLFSHQAVGIGMPLSNKFWDEKINQRRARFGMKIIHSKLVKSFYKKTFETPIATLILSDQSPGDSHKAYWTDFLNQETAVLFGCEQLAHTYDHAVVFFVMNKIKRGHYALEFKTITENPKNNEWGEITKQHTNLLESQIQKNPAYWIWSHKRWKRQVPTDLEDLKKTQKLNFNERFKK